MLGGGTIRRPDLGLLSRNPRARHRQELLLELQRLRVTHTVRKLHVGDFVWVAQETEPGDPGKGHGRKGRWQRPGPVGGWETQANRTLLGFLAARPGELVLDHIVERKRLDDLNSSIMDGRFHEQKVPVLASLCSQFPVCSRAPPQPRGARGTSGWPQSRVPVRGAPKQPQDPTRGAPAGTREGLRVTGPD